jgi:hypothetical protein
MAQKLLTLMKYTDRKSERIYGSLVQLFVAGRSNVNKVSNKLNREIRDLNRA